MLPPLSLSLFLSVFLWSFWQYQRNQNCLRQRRWVRFSFLSSILILPNSDTPTKNAEYPMSVIYDFVCTPPEEYGQSLDGDLHTTLMEFPTYTYTGKLVDTCPCLYDMGGGPSGVWWWAGEGGCWLWCRNDCCWHSDYDVWQILSCQQGLRQLLHAQIQQYLACKCNWIICT